MTTDTFLNICFDSQCSRCSFFSVSVPDCLWHLHGSTESSSQSYGEEGGRERWKAQHVCTRGIADDTQCPIALLTALVLFWWCREQRTELW